MAIYLLTVALYYIAFYIAIRLLGKRNRLDIVSPIIAKGDYIFETVIIYIVLSFTPIIRLIFAVAMYYTCFCSEETVKKIKK